MEKKRLIKFIATIMEDSGFNTQTNYQVENQVIDIYGTLETSVGQVGVVVACKNYEEPWKVGLDVLKEMEKAAKAVKASKIIVFSTNTFSHGAAVYAQKRNIKLVDKKGLMKIAQNYSQKQRVVSEPVVDEDDFDYDDYYYETSSRPASLNPNRGTNSHAIFSGRLSRNHDNGSVNQLQSTLYNQPRSYLSSTTSRTPDLRSKIPAININGMLEFFSEHTIIYLLVLLIIASLVSFILNRVTSGPFTGVGKIAASAIICYGGLLLVDRDISNVIFQGSIILFVSIIISIMTLTV
ncbi:MAG: restriction endonuclease [Methanosphaera sp.]|nr:restriction endonuclease [Methanosphaera sp.]